jgi:hypothetical protein
LEDKPVSNGMAFIPRSSNQFHCYRFRLRFVKREQEADPPNTSGQQQNITENLFPALRLRRARNGKSARTKSPGATPNPYHLETF